jgi:cellulose synthase/poly-beta-1,6-N-acetylglucosamine synthase-like glycosyltransferase
MPFHDYAVRVIETIHALTGIWLAVYGLNYLILMLLYLVRRRGVEDAPPVNPEDLPHVTVQVPVYNERHVVERVIDYLAALDYPQDRLQIQILDDSSDDTSQLARARAALHTEAGIDIQVLWRPARYGFKAGALDWGLSQARGDFIAIFDADFCPQPDFLQRTIPHLVHDPRLGMVQTRWVHINYDYSLITEAQAIVFDAHYGIEQVARCQSGLLMNFNGSGGVWRRRCLEEAGGWSSDTLTEDLDISFRAQLAGWKFLYLPEVKTPAELPPQVMAFKNQQARWAQGMTQTLRKLALPILRSRYLAWWQKVMALIHVSGYLGHGLLILHLLITLPWMLIPGLTSFPAEDKLGVLGLAPPLLFIYAQQQLHSTWVRRLRAFPLMLILGVGIAWSTTCGLWRGLTRWGGFFSRTPKFRLEGKADRWVESEYRFKADLNTIAEVFLALYALGASVVALKSGQYGVLPFTLLYGIGLGCVAGAGLLQSTSAGGSRSGS